MRMHGFLEHLGKFFIFIGVFFIMMGIFLIAGERFAFWKWFGHLPGDIHLRGKHYSIYIPLVTSLLISILLTFLLNLFLYVFRK